MEDKKVLLSLQNVEVKFNVRGRILTAIRNVSLDIFEGESIAIVGESGSGKSVLTKTFAGMLDSNGFVSNGKIIFSDDELSKTDAYLTGANERIYRRFLNYLNRKSVTERGREETKKIQELRYQLRHAETLTDDEKAAYNVRIKEFTDQIVELENLVQTLDKRNKGDAQLMAESNEKIAKLTADRALVLKEEEETKKQRAIEFKNNEAENNAIREELNRLTELRKTKIATVDNANNPNGLSDEIIARNERLAKEVVLSIGRFPHFQKIKHEATLQRAFSRAFNAAEDMNDENIINAIFDTVGFRVEFRSYEPEKKLIHGYALVDCAKVRFANDWQLIRGCRIATVFQDPMTSLNPVITIGKQIMTVILKHQKCSQQEAKQRTLDIMEKVGISDPEKRFNDYPFQYSGGMRQRIVIAIALSCQPKILICDEPTTALDVTIQAQILELIKSLQKELGFTTVYITHDLGVVANVAERVAVLYAGQIVELGTVEDIFYDPKHPYTWALLSSLPQLSVRGTELFSIPGTPPSLYNKIQGDAFAPRNKYVMAIDLEKEAPMFKVSDTHWAKTWLLDPRAPKVDPPSNIQNLHEKMQKTYINFFEGEEVQG